MIIEADEQQKIARDRLTWAEWGAKLTVEQFLARERRLREHAWSRTSMRTWLLVSDTGEILASCETFMIDRAYGFASVFTEEQKRGKGHGSRVVREVMERLRTEDKGVRAFILYSEVGAPLYERLGFQLCPSFERVFTPNRLGSQHPALRLLSRTDIAALWPAVPRPRTSFALWPTAEQIDWHFEREAAYAEALGHAQATVSGAQLGSCLALWACDYREECLQLIYLQSKTTLEAQSVLSVACQSAKASGFQHLRAWESESFAGWDLLGHSSRRISREGSLAMILPVAANATPANWLPISRALWI